jgi:bla regulator protein BlaR1
MDSSLFDQPYFQSVVNALCWTLIHSLWQGLVLAIMMGIVLLVTRKSAPALRYNLFTGLLLLFVLVNGATFFYVFEQNEFLSVSVHGFSDHYFNHSADASNNLVPSGFGYRFMETIASTFNQNANQIVILWLIGFLIKSFSTAAGLLYNERIGRMQISPVSESWNWQLRELAFRMGIYGRIMLMESGVVKVPVMHGFFSPMIIVPLGFLTSLPQQQIEAILLHELAHIKRKDYLVNFLQCVAENLYFFNPALLWVSYLVKTEREHCCDDLVIDVTQDQMSFVNALVSFKGVEIAVSNVGMSFIGNRNHLLNRIKRIIFNDNKQLTTMEKFALTSSLIAVTFLSMAYFSPLKQPEKTLNEIAPKIDMPIISEKLPVAKKEFIVKTKPVKRLAEPKVSVPADSVASIEKLMNDLKKAVNSQDLEAAETMKQRLLLMIWDEKQQVKAQTVEAKLRSGAFAIQKTQTIAGGALTNLQEAVLKSESEKLQARSAQINAIHSEFEKIGEEMWRERRQASATADKVMQEELIQDLIRENVIKNRENLSFKLHNMFLIVNGVEQPEFLHQKLKAKYLKRTWTEWVYNWDGATGHRFTGVRYNG